MLGVVVGAVIVGCACVALAVQESRRNEKARVAARADFVQKFEESLESWAAAEASTRAAEFGVVAAAYEPGSGVGASRLLADSATVQAEPLVVSVGHALHFVARLHFKSLALSGEAGDFHLPFTLRRHSTGWTVGVGSPQGTASRDAFGQFTLAQASAHPALVMNDASLQQLELEVLKQYVDGTAHTVRYRVLVYRGTHGALEVCGRWMVTNLECYNVGVVAGVVVSVVHDGGPDDAVLGVV